MHSQQKRVRSNGRSGIHICKFTFRAGRNRCVWLGDWLLYLGWSGLVRFSEEQSRGQPHDGLVGLLDAGVHAVPHRYLSADWTAWFNVFGKAAPLFMAGLAFTAYGIHWFAMSYRRYIDSSAQPDGWMAIAFLFLSILGADVFRRAGDIPVMLIFVGLTLIYAVEIPTRLLSWNFGGRIVGLFQFLTAIWLIYCAYPTTVDLALGAKAWV